MSDSCSHDCGSCGKTCADRTEGAPDFRAPLNAASKVKRVIAVASGKGGVGKSIVTTLLAVGAARRGLKTAILDADVTGPSIPRAFGLGGGTVQDERGILPQRTTQFGIQTMSLNLLVEDPSAPVVWRGPVIAGAVKQFWSDVFWDDVDVMFVDMPPGTGDVPLTVYQSLPVDGVVIVSSPQELVGMIVEKSVKMADMLQKKVLALVENMSYVECPGCKTKVEPFGVSRVAELAAKHGVGVWARLPIETEWARAIDKGAAEAILCPELDPVLDAALAAAV